MLQMCHLRDVPVRDWLKRIYPLDQQFFSKFVGGKNSTPGIDFWTLSRPRSSFLWNSIILCCFFIGLMYSIFNPLSDLRNPKCYHVFLGSKIFLTRFPAISSYWTSRSEKSGKFWFLQLAHTQSGIFFNRQIPQLALPFSTSIELLEETRTIISPKLDNW